MRPRFSLLFLFAILTICCVWAAAAFWLGWPTMVAITALLVVLHLPQIWFCSLVLAPQATKYASIFAMVGAIVLTLAACGIVQSREESRRNQTTNNLKQIGLNNQVLPQRQLPQRKLDSDSIQRMVEVSNWIDGSSNQWPTDPAGGKLSDIQSYEPPTSE